ncbi:MAG: cyclic nucleotide-binding domain-containing protein [Deltaproteobacteria bacterium]|nr:cyclic nucleotide-binding domain-containing protein [Deltaproteobacteria bacterium]
MLNKFLNFSGIEKKELSALSVICIRALLVAFTVVATYSYQSAVFLNVFHSSKLVWLYMAVAFATVIFSFPYSWLHNRVGEKNTDILSMLFFGSSGLIVWLFSELLLYPLTLFIFTIWIKLTGIFATINFWHSTVRAFPSRRAKVLFPVIAASFSLGSALAGKIVYFIATSYGVSTILPLLIVTIFLSIMFPVGNNISDRDTEGTSSSRKIFRSAIQILAGNPLAIYMTLFILFSIPVFLSSDFILKKALQETYSRDEMAAFLGNYQLYMNLGVFFLQTFFMGFLMKNLGVSKLTVFTPLFLAVTFPLLIFNPVLTFAMLIAVFSGVLRLTIYINSRNQLITPLGNADKEVVSIFLRTVIAPAGTVLTSLCLLPFKSSSIPVLASLGVVFAIGFGVFGYLAGRAYNYELVKALKKKTLNITSNEKLPPSPDALVLQSLRDQVVSAGFEEASFAATILAEYRELKLQDLNTFFSKNYHNIGILPRLKAIELGLYLKQSEKEAFFHKVMFESDDTRVLIEAVKIADHVREPWIQQLSMILVSSGENSFRKAMGYYLKTETDISDSGVVEELASELSDGDINSSILAIYICSKYQSKSNLGVIEKLLYSQKVEVVLTALRAIGDNKIEELYPDLFTLAVSSQLRRAAIDSIRACGLEKQFAEKFSSEPRLVRHVIRILCQNPCSENIAKLKEIISSGRIWKMSIALGEIEKNSISHLNNYLDYDFLQNMGGHWVALNAARYLHRSDAATSLFLETESTFALRCIFSLLRIHNPDLARQLESIEKSLSTTDKHQLNAALELLEDFPVFNQSSSIWFLEGKLSEGITGLESTCWRDFSSMTGRELVGSTGDEVLMKTYSTLVNLEGSSSTEDRLKDTAFLGAQLRFSGFFLNLATEITTEIARQGEIIRLKEGEFLFNEGDEGDGIYFILEGTMAVEISGKTVNTLNAGTVLGEIALLDKGKRSASIRPLKNSAVLKISPRLFDDMIQEYPYISKQIAITLVGHIRRLIPIAEGASHSVE